MKYPQLVSPRAVNAISDWLVSRLEQLGVESPQIYTRLLLSLLQSSVQVNDPIEFSNLEAFFANRKGGHKRFHLPSDTETLKKLNAVQCLREIVSNEQETATIELLVDELCEKLKDIEKQNQNLSDEERFLIETHLNTDSLLQNQTNTNHLQYQPHPKSSNNNNNNNTTQHRHHQPHNHHHTHHNNQQQQQQQQQQVTHICSKPHGATIHTDSKRHHVQSTSSTTCDSLNDLDNDPKKRYFRAFPALSKEMEDSFRIWRRNAKSLTWPIVGRSIVIDNLNNSTASLSSSSSSSIISSANFGANSLTTDKGVEKKSKGGVIVVGHQLGNKVSADIGGGDVQQHQGGGAAAAAAVAVTTSAKKKSKRRRNQALCKGKAIQNLRKLSVGTTSNSIGGNKYHQYTHHRSSSPAWDTDFKGCWEMGPDLIKEFLSRQNGTKRNHSSSDSMEHEEMSEHVIITNEITAKNEENSVMKSYIDLSFCYEDDDDDDDDNDVVDDLDGGNIQQQPQSIEEGIDYVDEDYDDSTLASVSELTMDSFNPKRLYQREGHSQKTSSSSSAFGGGNVLIGNTLEEDSNDSVDPLDFQQFKAKFNSSVEALWKGAAPTPNINKQQQQQQQQHHQSSVGMQNTETPLKLNNQLCGGVSTAFYANAMAPFKKDLWNFWSNYQHQQLDHSNNKLSATTTSTSSMITTMIDDSSASSAAGADNGNSSDYFSMPNNLNDFDKSVGGVRRRNDAGASLGAHTPSINVFLQNSIWSTSADCVDAVGGTTSAIDPDESFLFKVWHSNKKLSELDVGNAVNGEKMPTIVDENNDAVHNTDFNKSKESSSTIMVNNSNLGANLQFPPYQNSKWSEGINAGPPYGVSLLRAHNELQSLNSSASLRADNNYASFSSAASISGATWEAPAYGQNTQPDLKSWCASNPMSLTEMYGSDVCDSIVNNQTPADEDDVNQTENAIGPAVTLTNHCANTSGFVAYSRIKQCGIVAPQSKSLQTSNAARLPKDFFRNSVEEENLLTSERTHFHPIEHFVDGHTFDINHSLDTVEFERTSSGLMRYESEEFSEYTRSDIYMADEEVATSSTSLMKYGRKANEDKDKRNKFIIKFRVKRCGEIACQTEEQDFKLAAAKITDLPTSSTPLATFSPALEVNNMFNNTFCLSRQENNEAIMAAVTKAVAAAAKAAAENHLNAGHFCWQPIKITSASETPSVATNTKDNNNPLWRPDNSICDEVDFCKIDSGVMDQQQQLVQSWSMQEVEKLCHQRHGGMNQQQQLQQQQQQQQGKIKRKFPATIDIERSEENSLDNSSSLHTLWGMCAVCDNCGEYDKSMPADRLLRDELQLEADEIMSDLRYMQDLYIGESDILNEPNETQLIGENEQPLPADDKMFDYFNKEEIDSNSVKNPNNAWNVKDIKANKAQQHDLVQVAMLQKVNQLIEDLLKTENTRTLAKDAQEKDKHIIKQTTPPATSAAPPPPPPPPHLNSSNSVWNFRTDHQDKTKNFWQFSEQKDNNMWQHKPLIEQFVPETSKNNETFEKPMKLLKQLAEEEEEQQQQQEEEESYLVSKNKQYGEMLNWKHENLAKIWQQSMPTSTQIEEAVIKRQQTAEKATNHVINENSLKPQAHEEEEDDCQSLLVEEKNLKNLQNTYETVTPPSSTLQGSNYKIVEQFLNNSAAKMKLVANRKRRHSASQNFYQQQHLQFNDTSSSSRTGGNSCNNNNDTISDLNAYQHELQDTTVVPTAEEVAPYDNSNLNAEEQPKKQTIITCKYWTAATNGTQSSLDSAAAAMMLLAAATNANNANNMLTAATGGNHHHHHHPFDHHQEDLMLDENMFGNTFSCLIDKNASILKHVTMMTRPLTR